MNCRPIDSRHGGRGRIAGARAYSAISAGTSAAGPASGFSSIRIMHSNEPAISAVAAPNT